MDSKPGASGSLHTEKVPIELHGVPETLFATLYSRAVDAATTSPILGDPYAAETLARCEYDLSRTAMNTTQAAGVALRAKTFDRWTSAFLDAHAANDGATVVHLACGLDSRARRVVWGSGQSARVRWVDVDLPEVVEIRRKVMPLKEFEVAPDGTKRDYTLIAASVIDTDWLEAIPADRPTVVVMEGLLGYLAEEDVMDLLRRLLRRFSTGGEFFFDLLNWLIIYGQSWTGMLKRMGAVLQWQCDDPATLEALDQRLKMLECFSLADAPGVENMPLIARVSMGIISWTPVLRNTYRLVRFKF